MTQKTVHFLSSLAPGAMETACGRVGYLADSGAYEHTWHCALDEKSVELVASIYGERVTCKTCIRRLISETTERTGTPALLRV